MSVTVPTEALFFVAVFRPRFFGTLSAVALTGEEAAGLAACGAGFGMAGTFASVMGVAATALADGPTTPIVSRSAGGAPVRPTRPRELTPPRGPMPRGTAAVMVGAGALLMAVFAN